MAAEERTARLTVLIDPRKKETLRATVCGGGCDPLASRASPDSNVH